jgi:hypothetical protein
MIFSAHLTEAAINLSLRGLPWGPPNRSSAVCTSLRLIHHNSVADSSFVPHAAMSGKHSEFVINTETKGLAQGEKTSRVLSIPRAR